MTRNKGKAKTQKKSRPASVNGQVGSQLDIKETGPAKTAISSALQRYQSLLSTEGYNQLIGELEHPLPQGIRANPLKIDPDQAVRSWSERYGWEIRPIAYESTGWQILSAANPVSQTVEHRLGFYYIQDAASMLPAALFDLDPARPELILDMAASPGGKTTHLASRMMDHGLIIANDASASRLSGLRVVLQNWGAINIAITNYPGERFGEWYPETFDKVLLDAPCSMQSLRSTESHPMRPISENERRTLSLRQARLLESAFTALRPGGQVVYSTCTLAPEEDEAVVDSLLKRFPGSAQVIDVSSLLPAPAPGLTKDGEQIFSPEVEKTIRLWPHLFGTSGFFAAVITKKDSITGSRITQLQSSYPPSVNSAGSPRWLSQRQKNSLYDQLLQDYGFRLEELIEQQNLSLMQRNAASGKIYILAVPNLYLGKFGGLRYTNLGMLLGEESQFGFGISHEFAVRFGHTFQSGCCPIPDAWVDRWTAGEDLEDCLLPVSPVNRIVIVTDSLGRNLGRGKIHKNGIKNLLPKRLM